MITEHPSFRTRRGDRAHSGRGGAGSPACGVIPSVAPEIPPSLRPALEAYCERLRSVFGARLREVRLFGSYARGEANDASDVDILVLIDGLTSLEMLTA